MKKIMFNDRYGLTDAVLQGRKTMTRRLIPQLMGEENPDISEWGLTDGGKAMITLYEGGRPITDIFPMYQPGEVVAVAQSYKDICETNKEWLANQCAANEEHVGYRFDGAGWGNKMFVSAYYMPHQIRITNIKVKRLQDISETDCIREGVKQWTDYLFCIDGLYGDDGPMEFCEAREAFAALIDKVSGKGTWESNPFVFAYEFELYKEGGAE